MLKGRGRREGGVSLTCTEVVDRLRSWRMWMVCQLIVSRYAVNRILSL